MDPSMPVGFRQATVQAVMDNVRAGEATALVGVGSSGKSRLMRFLAEPRIAAHYLHGAWQPSLFVLVNGDDLVDYRDDNVYELLLTRLYDAVAQHVKQASDDLSWAEAHHQIQVLMQGPGGAVRRVFARAVGRLREQSRNVAFVLDDFDEAFQRCPDEVFAGLRALRDDHKFHLVYLVAGRRPMTELRATTPKFETFAELFAPPNTLFLKPYGPADALVMLAELTTRYRTSLSDHHRERLVWASGGHAGLLRAAFHVLREVTVPANWGALLNRMYRSRGVAEECRKILESLGASERDTLEVVSLSLADPLTATSSLLARGLLVPAGANHYQVFSPLLAGYIDDHSHRQPRVADDPAFFT